MLFSLLWRSDEEAMTASKHSGSYFDLPRTPGGGGSLGLQQLVIIAVALFFIPSIIFAFLNLNSTSALRTQRQPDKGRVPSLSISAQLNPTYEYVNGTEYVWQIPSESKPKGVLFLAHGCSCRSTFFWDKHPGCTTCTGMPEERTLVLHALGRGYAVIAISSTRECWSSTVDSEKVIKVLKSWILQIGLEALPVFGLGASSGGYFLSVLAVLFKFQSLVLQISPGRFEAMDFDATYPPTLFVHMPKDKTVAKRIMENMELLKSKGIRTDEVQCPELPITPHFFSERIPDLSDKVSEKIVGALRQYGCLIQKHDSYYMRRDGRQSGWKMALRKDNVLLGYDDRLKWEHALEEEMNLAFAYHELTSLPAAYILDWFQSSTSTSVENSSVLLMKEARGRKLLVV